MAEMSGESTGTICQLSLEISLFTSITDRVRVVRSLLCVVGYTVIHFGFAIVRLTMLMAGSWIRATSYSSGSRFRSMCCWAL